MTLSCDVTARPDGKTTQIELADQCQLNFSPPWPKLWLEQPAKNARWTVEQTQNTRSASWWWPSSMCRVCLSDLVSKIKSNLPRQLFWWSEAALWRGDVWKRKFWRLPRGRRWSNTHTVKKINEHFFHRVFGAHHINVTPITYNSLISILISVLFTRFWW